MSSSDFDIQSIAKLARIKVDPAQEAQLKQSIENVLGFADQIKQANVPYVEPKDFFRLTKNRLRQDNEPEPTGLYTKEIMRVVPNQQNGMIKVKKILSGSSE